jgi:hypothetical protein
MISSEENNNWFVPLLIVTILIIVLGILYASTDFIKQGPTRGLKEFDYAGRPVQQMVYKDQLILKRYEKFVIGRNGLVFKGVEKKTIIVDLYLLDMDPEQAYEKRFLKKDAKRALSLGEGTYRLQSVNNNHLILKKISNP